MNKTDFVQAIAEKTGSSQADAGKSIDAVIAVTFQVVDRAATEGRHPRTGEKITIPASKRPKFKAGAELKRALGGNG